MAAEQHGVLLPRFSPELKPLNLCSTAALEPPMSMCRMKSQAYPTHSLNSWVSTELGKSHASKVQQAVLKYLFLHHVRESLVNQVNLYDVCITSITSCPLSISWVISCITFCDFLHRIGITNHYFHRTRRHRCCSLLVPQSVGNCREMSSLWVCDSAIKGLGWALAIFLLLLILMTGTNRIVTPRKNLHLFSYPWVIQGRMPKRLLFKI